MQTSVWVYIFTYYNRKSIMLEVNGQRGSNTFMLVWNMDINAKETLKMF